MEQWAELRREHFVRGVSIKELMRCTGLARNTVRSATGGATPGGLAGENRRHLDPQRRQRGGNASGKTLRLGNTILCICLVMVKGCSQH